MDIRWKSARTFEASRSAPDERSQVQTKGLPGQPARRRSTGAEAAPAAGAGAGATASGRTRPEDAQPDGGSRGVPLHPLRQPAVAAGRAARSLLALRRRRARLHPLRLVRHQREVGMHAARSDPRPRRAERRPEQLRPVYSANDGRTPDRHSRFRSLVLVAVSLKQRQKSVRRSLQVSPGLQACISGQPWSGGVESVGVGPVPTRPTGPTGPTAPLDPPPHWTLRPTAPSAPLDPLRPTGPTPPA